VLGAFSFSAAGDLVRGEEVRGLSCESNGDGKERGGQGREATKFVIFPFSFLVDEDQKKSKARKKKKKKKKNYVSSSIQLGGRLDGPSIQSSLFFIFFSSLFPFFFSSSVVRSPLRDPYILLHLHLYLFFLPGDSMSTSPGNYSP
jgi:hypothetical protein